MYNVGAGVLITSMFVPESGYVPVPR